MIFVGGPLHGRDIDVPAVQQTALEIATDQPTTLPPTYLDPASGEPYVLAAMRFAVAHPLTGQPQTMHEHDMYVHHSIAGMPPLEMYAKVTEAVMRWWSSTGRLAALPGATAPGAANGHRTTYLVRCPACGDSQPFGDIIARAYWASKHIDATGHKKLEFSEQPEEATPDANAARQDRPAHRPRRRCRPGRR